MDQYHHRENHDIRHSYQADDIMTRFKKSRQRESKYTTKQLVEY